jgi:hypothetical protein
VTLEGKSLEADLYDVIHLARATGSHLLEVDASELQYSDSSIAGKSEVDSLRDKTRWEILSIGWLVAILCSKFSVTTWSGEVNKYAMT